MPENLGELIFFFTDANNCELNPGCSLCFRVEELASALVEEKKLTAKLQSERGTQEWQMEAFKKVVSCNSHYSL